MVDFCIRGSAYLCSKILRTSCSSNHHGYALSWSHELTSSFSAYRIVVGLFVVNLQFLYRIINILKTILIPVDFKDFQ